MILITMLEGSAAAITLSVDVTTGGLQQAAVVLTARHHVSVNHEAVPHVLEGAGWVRPEGATRMPTRYTLTFHYESDATPRQAAQAAVDAWNAKPGVEAYYHVLESEGILHFVPDHVLTEAGTYVEYTPLLDTVVTLDRTTGEPTKLYHDIVQKLSNASGVGVYDAMEGFLVGSANITEDDPKYVAQNQTDITLSSAHGTVRSLLNAVLTRNDTQNRWDLHWMVDEQPDGTHWAIAFKIARASDDGPPFNRTPTPDR